MQRHMIRQVIVSEYKVIYFSGPLVIDHSVSLVGPKHLRENQEVGGVLVITLLVENGKRTSDEPNKTALGFLHENGQRFAYVCEIINSLSVLGYCM